MKTKKASIEWLGKEVIGLILSAIVLFFLFYLGISIYSWSNDQNDIKKAQAELNAIVDIINNNFDKTIEKRYIISTVSGWYLMSSEYGDICGGNYCLCLCRDESCGEGSDKIFSCAKTDKFVLLREKDPYMCGENAKNDLVEVRKMKLGSDNSVTEIKIKYSDKKVYPFSGDLSLLQIASGKINRLHHSILLSDIDNNLKWSFDLENWQSLDNREIKGNIADYVGKCSLDVSGRFTTGPTPPKVGYPEEFLAIGETNEVFFNQLISFNLNQQKEHLNQAKVKLSDGVFIFENEK